MKEKTTNAFIPRDKPKSLIIFFISFLSGLVVVFIAYLFDGSEFGIIISKGLTLCWLVGFISMIVYFHGWFTGRYKNMKELPWKEQVW